MRRLIMILLIPMIPFLAWFGYDKQKSLGGSEYTYWQAFKDVWNSWWVE